MRFFGLHIAGTSVPSGELCPKSLRSTSLLPWTLLPLLLIINPDKVLCQGDLTPGQHNTNPITGCTGYNPARLIFTTPTSGGLPPYSYQWQLNNMAIPGETLNWFDPPQINVPGVYSYNCVITDASGTVVATNPKVITVVPDPTVAISGAGTFCLDTAVTLTATVTYGIGTFSYQWQLSVDNSTFTSVPGATASTYSPATSTAGTLYYRVNIFPAVGSCNNAVSAAVAVTVNGLPVTSLIYHF